MSEVLGAWLGEAAERGQALLGGGEAIRLREDQAASAAYWWKVGTCSVEDGAGLCEVTARVGRGAKVVAHHPTATGHARVRATVFSPSGPPRVRLDDTWDLVSVVPSDGNLAAYDVDIALDDSSPRPHHLTVIPPEGAPARRDFAPPSLFQNSRALVIGNELYRDPGVSRLPGARKDAADIAGVLQDEVTWHLPANRVRLAPDLEAVALEREVRAFFEGASPNETLLFYYAGHGDRDGDEGFLLPVDHVPGKTEGRLSASALWKLIGATRAERVVVILDACRAGAFLVPESLAARADVLSKPVAFLTSASASTTTPDDAAGGPFTQALVSALKLVKNVDPSQGAVTVRKAFHDAADRSGVSARIGGKLDNLQLAWPRDPSAAPTRTALRMQGAMAGTRIAELSASLETTRQLIAKGDVKGKAGGPRTIEIAATLSEDAEWIRVGVYYFDEPTPAKIEILAPSLDGPRFRKGQRVPLAVPVPEVLKAGTYHVQVQPCGAGAVCGKETPATFDVEL